MEIKAIVNTIRKTPDSALIGWASIAMINDTVISKKYGHDIRSPSLVRITALLRALEPLAEIDLPHKITVITSSTHLHKLLKIYVPKWDNFGYVTVAGTPVKYMESIKKIWEILNKHGFEIKSDKNTKERECKISRYLANAALNIQDRKLSSSEVKDAEFIIAESDENIDNIQILGGR